MKIGVKYIIQRFASDLYLIHTCKTDTDPFANHFISLIVRMHLSNQDY